MKQVSLIGATGSIGRQTLEVIAAHPDRLKIIAMATGTNNLEDFARQTLQFEPELVAVPNSTAAQVLVKLLGKSASGVSIHYGEEGLEQVAAHPRADIVVTAVVGFLGVRPTICAIKQGKTIALANKETLVAAGSVIVPMIKEYGAKLIPIDSEHSAIHQSLHGHSSRELSSIWLTASGGPFRTWSYDQLKNATVSDALKHPNWSMGKKITIDSATLMNKGLEIIEARWLFDIAADKIRVVIHPQSILHSAVEFNDGSMIGQLGIPDMHLPIHYALFYPERVASSVIPRLNLAQISSLTFEEPDLTRFPCLGIAQEVAKEDNTLPSVLNAANEVLVGAFLENKLKFLELSEHLKRVLNSHKAVSKPTLEDILEADQWARNETEDLLRCSGRMQCAPTKP